MFEFFNKFFNKQASKDIAKERLKLVIIHDRANVSPELLELIKNEILKAIQKYIVIDDKLLEIQITRTPSEQKGEFVPALIANIPIKSVKKTEILNNEADDSNDKKKVQCFFNHFSDNSLSYWFYSNCKCN